MVLTAFKIFFPSQGQQVANEKRVAVRTFYLTTLALMRTTSYNLYHTAQLSPKPTCLLSDLCVNNHHKKKPVHLDIGMVFFGSFDDLRVW
jgi:hypothetical protein